MLSASELPENGAETRYVSPQKQRAIEKSAAKHADWKARQVLQDADSLADSKIALDLVVGTMRDAMEASGLTDRVLVNKYLKPALKARETQFFAHKGVVMDERDVIAWGTRTRALDMAFQLKGSYAPRQAQVDMRAQFSLADTIRAARERANAAMGLPSASTVASSVASASTLAHDASDSRLDR